MKKAKKVGALLLALVMCLSVSVVAFGASTNSSEDTKFSIGIENAAYGETYTAYKIFDVTYNENGGYAYTIDSNSAWYSIVAAATDVFTLTKVAGEDTVYNVTVNEGVEDDAVIAVFTEAGVPEGAKSAGSTTANNSGTGRASIDVTESGPGYYYVTTTLGSLVIVSTTDPEPYIEEKNGQPTLKKYVHENSDSATDADNEGYWDPEDDANNNDDIQFEIIINDVTAVANLILHDSMDSELEIPDESDFHMTSVILYTSEDAEGIELTEDTDYTVTVGECTSTNCELGSCAFEVNFSNYDFSDVDSTGFIVIRYSLHLNTEGDEYEFDEVEIENQAQLTYGSASYSTIVTAETYSFGFEIYKYHNEEAIEAVQLGLGMGQNWYNYVNVYSGGQGGVKSVELPAGTYVLDGIYSNSGIESWRDFDAYDEFALLQVTGSEPTADIKTGDPDTDGEAAYTPNETDGGYTIVTDDEENWIYYIISKNPDGQWVVNVEEAGRYVLVGYNYNPVYHGDVGGHNWAEWKFSGCAFSSVSTKNQIDKVVINADGTISLYNRDGGSEGYASTVSVNVVDSLANAEFEITNSEGETAYFLYEEDLGEYLLEGWLSSDETCPEGYTTTVKSADDGMIYVEGLDAGTYTLTETAAPDGFNRLTSTIYVTITETYDSNTGLINGHTVEWSIGNEEGTGIINVENNTGTELPSTGGIGTAIFYIVGGAIVLAAVVILIARRRTNRGEAEAE